MEHGRMTELQPIPDYILRSYHLAKKINVALLIRLFKHFRVEKPQG